MPDHFDIFFQAEDGIRDVAVTGVQTCALPISPEARRSARRLQRLRLVPRGDGALRESHRRPSARSEERRVGKEYSYRRSVHLDKKVNCEYAVGVRDETTGEVTKAE